MARHLCTVCHSWYRSWPLHATSTRHMRNLRQRANPSTSRKGIRGAFRPHRSHRRVHDDATYVQVDKYRRNPPTPPWPGWLTERLVRVRDHFRRPPYGGSSIAPHIARLRRRRRR